MRKLLVVLAILLVVLGGAVLFAATRANTWLNENRDWIEAEVEKNLGRDVSLGEVGVSLWGGFGASVADLEIADDPAFSSEKFVEADLVRVVVDLWAALFGEISVDRIVLERPVVRVIERKSGFNFDSIGAGSESAATSAPEAVAADAAPAPGGEAPPAAGSRTSQGGGASTEADGTAPPTKKGGSAAPPLVVSVLEIRGGTVYYRDEKAKPASETVLRNLDLEANDIAFDRSIRIWLRAGVLGSEERNLEVSGTVGPLDAEAGIPLDVTVDLGPVVLDELRKVPGLSESLPAELESPDPVSASVEAKGTTTALDAKVRFTATDARLAYVPSFRKARGVPFTLDADARVEGEQVTIRDGKLALADLALSWSGKASPESYDLQLRTNEASLAGWEEILPALAEYTVSGTAQVDLRAAGRVSDALPTLDGFIALQNVAARQSGSPYEVENLTTKIQMKKDTLTVPPTSFSLGGSPVTLEADVKNFADPRVTFSLESPSIAPASLGFGGEGLREPESVDNLKIRGEARDVGTNLRFAGSVSAGKGMLRDVPFQNLKADMTLKDQVARLESLSLDAFEGAYRGKGSYDMRRADRPAFDFQSVIEGMNVTPLLRTGLDVSGDRISGTLFADLALKGAGSEWDEVRSNLLGQGRVEVRDGVWKDVNVAESVLSGVTGIPGLSNLLSPKLRERYPSIFATGDTKFEELGGTVQIADGKATTNDLAIAARDYALRAKGTIGLEGTADMKARMIASEGLTKALIDDVKELKYLTEDGRVVLPFEYRGDLATAKPRPDREFIQRAIAKAAVGRGIEELIEKQGGKEGELIKKGLEGLFGR